MQADIIKLPGLSFNVAGGEPVWLSIEGRRVGFAIPQVLCPASRLAATFFVAVVVDKQRLNVASVSLKLRR